MTSEELLGSGDQPYLLPRHVAVLGVISLLTAMSSAMVYGLLPGPQVAA
jgi:hypothetical protein